MSISKLTYSLLFFVLSVFILYIAKDLILPLAIAIFISFIISELASLLGEIRLGRFQISKKLQQILAFASIACLLLLFGNILFINIQHINDVIPVYQKNIDIAFSKFVFLDKYDLKLISQDWLGDFDLSGIAKTILDSLSSVLSNSFLIFLYLIFISLEKSVFSTKIRSLYTNKKDNDHIRFILDHINQSMSSYISLKTITSLSTGILSYIILYFLEIDFAFFWAFLIFVLNYIPTIGSLLATLFPFVIALLQYADFRMPLAVLILIGFIQFLVGNIVEPKLMGNTLNVSPLVVLISLAFWGAIWGITGMVLSVPITIMIIIASSQFESTRWLAILLSENGKILEKS